VIRKRDDTFLNDGLLSHTCSTTNKQTPAPTSTLTTHSIKQKKAFESWTDLQLGLVGFSDAEGLHVSDFAGQDVHARRGVAGRVRRAELCMGEG